MKPCLALLLMVTMCLPAVAHDLGNRAPAKPAGAPVPPSPPVPELQRQGGDTIADAVRIPIPTVDLAGTTTGYNDDYHHDCPYWSPPAPDVVYSIVPDVDMSLDIDMYGSEFDTKIYVYDQTLDWPIACNDDYYPDYTSKIEDMPVIGGAEYFIVVDGYGEHGPYLIDVVEHVPCVLDCPPGAVLEGEPPLAVDYLDVYNGGCNADPAAPPLQPITSPVFCGVSGFYLLDGANHRDTDWFLVDIPAGGVLEIIGDAEIQSYLFELAPQDCNEVGVMQNVMIGDCLEGDMLITGEPGATVWIWVGPTSFASPDGSDVFEYDYTLWLNLDPVAVEEHSWTGVKALFD